MDELFCPNCHAVFSPHVTFDGAGKLYCSPACAAWALSDGAIASPSVGSRETFRNLPRGLHVALAVGGEVILGLRVADTDPESVLLWCATWPGGDKSSRCEGYRRVRYDSIDNQRLQVLRPHVPSKGGAA